MMNCSWWLALCLPVPGLKALMVTCLPFGALTTTDIGEGKKSVIIPVFLRLQESKSGSAKPKKKKKLWRRKSRMRLSGLASPCLLLRPFQSVQFMSTGKKSGPSPFTLLLLLGGARGTYTTHEVFSWPIGLAYNPLV